MGRAGASTLLKRELNLLRRTSELGWLNLAGWMKITMLIYCVTNSVPAPTRLPGAAEPGLCLETLASLQSTWSWQIGQLWKSGSDSETIMVGVYLAKSRSGLDHLVIITSPCTRLSHSWLKIRPAQGPWFSSSAWARRWGPSKTARNSSRSQKRPMKRPSGP